MNQNSTIYIRVNVGEGFGFGHFKRCLDLGNYLRNYYRIKIFSWGDEQAENILQLDSFSYKHLNNESEFIDILQQEKPEIVIFDTRDSDESYMKKIRTCSKVITFDDLGSGSHYANLTFHLLPTPSKSFIEPNFDGVDYLILNHGIDQYKKKKLQPDGKILISFGGEDPYNLTESTIQILQQNLLPNTNPLAVILGPLYKRNRNFKNVKILESPKNLYQEIKEASLLITSFGMTVFESLYIGTPVLTINPTEYHNDLANQVQGIINLGVMNEENEDKISRQIEDVLTNYDQYFNKKVIESTIDLLGMKRIKEKVDKLILTEDETCPICNEVGYVHHRSDWSNSYYCNHCHTFYRSSEYDYEIDYNDDYFTTQYQNQYGKTYLQDKNQINVLNKKRLNHINQLIRKTNDNPLQLLELGSAMGFFLEMARDQGYDVRGVELSEYACGYAQKELGLSVFYGDVSHYAMPENSFDVIAAWYFIEHHSDFKTVLRKMKSLLKPNGLIALSTPNAYGISYQTNSKNYIHKIPLDHYIEFSPKSLSNLLEKEGFQIEKIVITGIHPNRLIQSRPLLSRLFSNQNLLKLFGKPIRWFMKQKNLGDTFEIYARKL